MEEEKEIEYAVEEYDEDGRFYLQYDVYSSLNEAEKGLINAKADYEKEISASASFPAEKGHSFGILKIVYKNGLEVEAERME